MNEGRFSVLPDDRLAQLKPMVSARIREAADMLGEGAFDEFFDRTMRSFLLEGLNQAGAHEGTVWLLDHNRSNLVPRFNSGPDAANFVGRFRQTLDAGMISMVVATEQPICENEVHRNQRQDPKLDRKLGLTTCAMIAVPFYFAGQVRGVISGVQLRRPSAPDAAVCGFSPQSLASLQRTALILARLIEHELITLSLGLESCG